MHMSATLLPLQQPICSALPPPNSPTASLLPPQFQVLCTAAHTRTTSSRRHSMSSSGTVCVRESNNREYGARPMDLCGLDAP